MKGRPIDQIVYGHMFPNPKPNDPRNFQALLGQCLVPEVRLETQAFYGSLSTQEAKYPGLDYSHTPHRMRLGRYQWHRRLFRAFNNLRLTHSEIAALTKWEGTSWAKERYEKEQGILIRDTTADCIGDFVEPENRNITYRPLRHASTEAIGEIRGEMRLPGQHVAFDQGEDEDTDEEVQSVGLELNERLRAAVAQREAGNTVVMDEEWEQWLKDAYEAGRMPSIHAALNMDLGGPGPRHAPGAPTSSAADRGTTHPSSFNDGGARYSTQISEMLENIFHTLDNERRDGSTESQTLNTPWSDSSQGASATPVPRTTSLSSRTRELETRIDRLESESSALIVQARNRQLMRQLTENYRTTLPPVAPIDSSASPPSANATGP